MMSEASFASLGPTLLARKGGAKPAMRPQLTPLPENISEFTAIAEEQLEDLGWNDMGSEDAANDVLEDEIPLLPAKRAGKTETVLISSQDEEDEPDLVESLIDDESCEAEDDENPKGPHPIIDPLTSANVTPLIARKAERSPANEDTFDTETPVDVSEQERRAQRLLAKGDAQRAEALDAPLPEPEVEGPLLRAKRGTAGKAKRAKKVSKPRTKANPSSAKGATARRAAFTLRLDTDRHLKLRVAATMQGISAQSLVTEALDALLDDIDDLETLVERMKRD
ncbi:MAG: hypothetical protein AAGA34_14590 [Pseudomonadota bacterium]